jgi:hypothetical protein
VNRRGLLASAAAVIAWPIAVQAQEVGRTYRLGFLTPVARDAPAVYVDRIFKGAKPADLPVEQSAKLELFIHRGTAKMLGLNIPADIIALANDVIE